MRFFLLYPFILHQFLFSYSVSDQIESAILINAENGRVIFEKNAHVQKFPASVTKIATALVALDYFKLDLAKTCNIEPHLLKTASMNEKKKFAEKYPPYFLEPDGTTINLQANETISLKTLIYGLMLGSGNDAANAISNYCAGNIELFLKIMNEYLKKIGCKNTKFLNPHGLHHDQHLTTAYDLALMAKKAMTNTTFSEIVKTTQYTREETNKQKSFQIVQTNRLIKQGPFFYPKATGIKTGYTSLAGYNLVASASNGKRNLIAVLLGSKVSENRYKDAASLFEQAFNEKQTTQKIYAAGADVFKNEIEGGTKALKACLKRDLEVSFYPSEPVESITQIKWFSKDLPIKVDECVGIVEVCDIHNNQLIERAELYSLTNIDYTAMAKVKKHLRSAGQLIFMNKFAVFLAFSFFLIALAVDRRSRREILK